METVLFVITIMSVASAIAALASAQRMKRAERERSAARVSALSAAADTPGTNGGGWIRVAGEWRWDEHAGPAGVGDSGLGTKESEEGEVAELFGTVQREETHGGRLPLVAAAALIAILGGTLVFLNSPAPGTHEAATVPAAHGTPLELLSLGHARDDRALTISGTVRNPTSGLKVEALTAVVSLLDGRGTLISTKDVPLDYRALGPGEEAPFRISVPDPGAIARYRVSFRAGADVVPHVDRRSETKLASALR
jgi:hypothetical protein